VISCRALSHWLHRESAARYTPFLMGSRYSLEPLRAGFSGLNQETGREELLAALVRGLCEYQREHLREISSKVALSGEIFVTGGALNGALIQAKRLWLRDCAYRRCEQSSLRARGPCWPGSTCKSTKRRRRRASPDRRRCRPPGNRPAGRPRQRYAPGFGGLPVEEVADAAQEGVQGAGGDQAPLPMARQDMLEAARGQDPGHALVIEGQRPAFRQVQPHGSPGGSGTKESPANNTLALLSRKQALPPGVGQGPAAP